MTGAGTTVHRQHCVCVNNLYLFIMRNSKLLLNFVGPTVRPNHHPPCNWELEWVQVRQAARVKVLPTWYAWRLSCTAMCWVWLFVSPCASAVYQRTCRADLWIHRVSAGAAARSLSSLETLSHCFSWLAGECRNPADCCCVAKLNPSKTSHFGVGNVSTNHFMCWRARQFDLSAVKQRKQIIDLQQEVQRLQERGTNDEFVTRLEVRVRIWVRVSLSTNSTP